MNPKPASTWQRSPTPSFRPFPESWSDDGLVDQTYGDARS